MWSSFLAGSHASQGCGMYPVGSGQFQWQAIEWKGTVLQAQPQYRPLLVACPHS